MKKLQVLLAAGFTMMAINGFAQHSGKQVTSKGLSANTDVTTALVKQLSQEEVRKQVYSNIHTTSAANSTNRSMFAYALTANGDGQLVKRQSLATMPVQGKEQPLRANDNRLEERVSTDSYNQIK